MIESMNDLGSTSALSAAVAWIQNLLTGSIGTPIAIIAVASIGFMLFFGRLSVGRGITVIVGCFVLFSAATIAQALTGAVQSAPRAAESLPTPDIVPVPPPPMAPPTPYDPYAGASLPVQPPQHDLLQN